MRLFLRTNDADFVIPFVLSQSDIGFRVTAAFGGLIAISPHEWRYLTDSNQSDVFADLALTISSLPGANLIIR